MTTFIEAARQYTAKLTLNITDLERIPVDIQIFDDGEGIDSKGKTFYYSYFLINNEEYRVPNSVLKQLQEIEKVKPDVKFVVVTKKGVGLNTDYTTVPL